MAFYSRFILGTYPTQLKRDDLIGENQMFSYKDKDRFMTAMIGENQMFSYKDKDRFMTI